MFIKNLNFNEIRDIIISSRSCFFVDGCVLKAKSSSVIFDLGTFGLIDKISVYFRRNSGNGIFTIEVGECLKEERVLATTNIDIDLLGCKTIKISRPNHSIGDIVITGIDILLNQEETKLAKNWKAILYRCNNYNGIKLSNSRLFVIDGGYIEDNSNYIKDIVTEPPYLYQKDDNKFKFYNHCEILDIITSGDVPLLKSNIDIFSSHGAPFPNLVKEPLVSHTDNKEKSFMENEWANSWIVYDSAVSSGFSGFISNSKELAATIKSNKEEFLILRKGGISHVPLLTIDPNIEYNITINAKKLNGNGKIYIWMSDSIQSVNYKKIIIINNNFSDQNIALTPSIVGGPCKLYLSMDNDGVGEVLVARVRVFQNVRSEQAEILNKYYSNNPPKNLTKINSANIPPKSIDLAYQIKSDKIISKKKHFVIVIPSYNNAKWVEKNIQSVINQNYNNYRIIYTDDCSEDGTFEKVSEIVNSSSKREKFTLIKNIERIGALHNLYNMIYSCDDEEIILTLDGDDWLVDENVLNKLNQVYFSDEVWMTYGQYQNFPDGGRGIAQAIPGNVIADNYFRHYTWCASHLRTFYTWLFKSIKKEDFLYKGAFMSMAWDMTIQFPMLEMSSSRSKFINDILYVYNLENPINDHKVNVKLQQDLDRYVRAMPKYQKLTAPTTNQEPIGLLIIATGKYHEYIQGLISSADNYFLKGMNVTYYVFSDKEHNIRSNRPIVQIPTEHKPFPYATLLRYQYFTNSADILSKNKYLYYIDVDCLFVDHIGTEILGSRTAVVHCGFFNNTKSLVGPLETGADSTAYVNEEDIRNKYQFYYAGGFFGCKVSEFLTMAKICSENIEKDLEKGKIALWHDESHENRYFMDNVPDVVLSPGYHYPQSNLERYKKIWGRDFTAKILLLDKNHSLIRS